MKHNKNSAFEKPSNECPPSCGNCKYYQSKGYIFSVCEANDCKTEALSYVNPRYNPVPFNLNCYWWYANEILNKLSSDKKNDYKEERLHLFTAEKILSDLPHSKERKDFIKHLFRKGGGKLIDFEIYPEYKEVYEDIKRKDGVIT